MNYVPNQMSIASVKELKEYYNVLKPLVKGLDILQGEDNCFNGILLPSFKIILQKTKAIKHELSSMTMGLADSMEASTQ